MQTFKARLGVFAVSAAAAILATPAQANTTFGPTSLELLYEPVYSLASGGTTSEWSPLGAGLRIGFGMTPIIAFELGGYYDGYVFGGINGGNVTAYATRGTADFAIAPHPGLRFYAGIDANVFFNPPAEIVASTTTRDLGVIGGVRVLLGGWWTKIVIGAEYRYAIADTLTYSGGSINTSAVIGTFGLHFGGL